MATWHETQNRPPECAGCGKVFEESDDPKDRVVRSADGRLWHPDCWQLRQGR
jgi:hypothetical protein